jgi:O-antigen/teichoic acid export membrane protein
VLLAGSALAYLAGPAALGAVMPKYLGGLPALRPLMPGMVLLGLAWPARQMLIAVGRPYRLCLATLAGLAVTAAAGAAGADRAGIVGVAWGMTVGYAAVFGLTSASALVPLLGVRAWLGHVGNLARTLAWFAAGALLSAHAPTGLTNPVVDLAARCGFLTLWLLPPLLCWARRLGRGRPGRVAHTRRDLRPG